MTDWQTIGQKDGFKAGLRIKKLNTLDDAARIINKLRNTFAVDMRKVLGDKVSEQARATAIAQDRKRVSNYITKGAALLGRMLDAHPEYKVGALGGYIDPAMQAEFLRQLGNNLLIADEATVPRLYEEIFRQCLKINQAIYASKEAQGEYTVAYWSPSGLGAWLNTSGSGTQLSTANQWIREYSAREPKKLWVLIKGATDFMVYFKAGKPISEAKAKEIIEKAK